MHRDVVDHDLGTGRVRILVPAVDADGVVLDVPECGVGDLKVVDVEEAEPGPLVILVAHADGLLAGILDHHVAKYDRVGHRVVVGAEGIAVATRHDIVEIAVEHFELVALLEVGLIASRCCFGWRTWQTCPCPPSRQIPARSA